MVSSTYLHRKHQSESTCKTESFDSFFCPSHDTPGESQCVISRTKNESNDSVLHTASLRCFLCTLLCFKRRIVMKLFRPTLMGKCIPNQTCACFVRYFTIINPPLFKWHVLSELKLSEKLKNDT